MTALHPGMITESIARQQDELIKLLQALIRIPSESDARAPARAFPLRGMRRYYEPLEME